MPTNVDKAAKKAAREEACAKAKQWSESLKGKGGSGTNVKSTNAAKSPYCCKPVISLNGYYCITTFIV